MYTEKQHDLVSYIFKLRPSLATFRRLLDKNPLPHVTSWQPSRDPNMLQDE